MSKQLLPTAHVAAEWMRILARLADPVASFQPSTGPAYEAVQGAEGGPGILKLLPECMTETDGGRPKASSLEQATRTHDGTQAAPVAY